MTTEVKHRRHRKLGHVLRKMELKWGRAEREEFMEKKKWLQNPQWIDAKKEREREFPPDQRFSTSSVW